jgi:hypothetical protein
MEAPRWAPPVIIPLLDHCLKDPRQHARLLYPLQEILLHVLSATLAGTGLAAIRGATGCRPTSRANASHARRLYRRARIAAAAADNIPARHTAPYCSPLATRP